MVEPDRLQMRIRRMRVACWINEAKDTHSEYVTIIAFPRRQWLRECTSMLHYTYVAYFVITESASVYCEVRAKFYVQFRLISIFKGLELIKLLFKVTLLGLPTEMNACQNAKWFAAWPKQIPGDKQRTGECLIKCQYSKLHLFRSEPQTCGTN
jgi:hypothetical protein